MNEIILSLIKQHKGADRNIGFFIDTKGDKINEITISNETQLLEVTASCDPEKSIQPLPRVQNHF